MVKGGEFWWAGALNLLEGHSERWTFRLPSCRSLEGPAEHFFGVVPNLGGVGAEGDGDDAFAIEDAGGDEATTGGVGRAGFHAGAVGKTGEDFVGVGDGSGPSVRVGEGVCPGFHALAKVGVLVDFPGEDGDVEGGGILTGFSESVGVEEVGLGHAEGPRGAVHLGGEGFFGAGDVPGKGESDVVSAFDEEGFNEGFTGVGFSGFDVDLGGFDEGVGPFDGDGVAERTAPGGDEGGEEFLSAGDGPGGAGILLKEDAAGDHVDDDGAFGTDDRVSDGGEVWLDVLRLNEDRCGLDGLGTRCLGRRLLGTACDKGKGNDPCEKFPKLHMRGSVPKFGAGASERSDTRRGGELVFPSDESGRGGVFPDSFPGGSFRIGRSSGRRASLR